MQTSQPQEKDPCPVSELIRQDELLAVICKKMQLIQLAKKILLPALPKTLFEHCEIANIEGPTLTITASNASWGTQMRYLQQTLFAALKKEPRLCHIIDLKVRIKPPQNLIPKPRRKVIPMSRDSSALIKECATEVAHVRLREALLKLALNGKGN